MIKKKKIREEDLELVALTTKELLLKVLDATVFSFQMFDHYSAYKHPIWSYKKWRVKSRTELSRKMHDLKRRKLINIYREGKEGYIEITLKGLETIKKYCFEELEIEKPKKWDKKWRVVIFDIPDDEKVIRNILRDKLKYLGFRMVQKSVFVHPFDCFAQISFIRSAYDVSRYVVYIVADVLETDKDMVGKFLDDGILTEKLIKSA